MVKHMSFYNSVVKHTCNWNTVVMGGGGSDLNRYTYIYLKVFLVGSMFLLQT
jgi:hypothetical protein